MTKLWTADELARHRFHYPYLVEPIIPRGGVVLLHGKRGIGKSHLMLTLAACLDERGMLFGRYPVNPSGPVLYIQADMPIVMMQQRVHRAQTVYPLTSTILHFPDFFNIMSEGLESEFTKTVMAYHPALIVWDTLRKIQHMDLNAQEPSGLVYGWARHLFPNITHLFVHHDRKDTEENKTLDEEESFSGSGAWVDNAQTSLHLKEVSQGRLVLAFTKTQGCEPQSPINLTLNPETLLLYASSERAAKLREWWLERHPNGDLAVLERFLLASFVGSPRIARQLATGEVTHV